MKFKNEEEKQQKEKGVDLEEYHENEEITVDYDKNLAVECKNGIFVGLKDGDVISYKGIPYAEPPIGKNRFKPPIKKQISAKVFQAYYLGKTCIQTVCDSEMASHYEQGEDCLTLNIWRNTSSSLQKKPVMVFIHGGAFGWGGTADPLYEGTNLLKTYKDIILVTINYRVNILGFINLSILEGGENYKESGNLGMLDQVCALEWVKENISNFGGDPNNVTIFGESAGGCAVSILPLMKGTKNLFHHVIAQSGTYQFTNSIETSLLIAEKIIKITGAKSVEDLLKIAEGDIYGLLESLGEELNIFPVRDGVILPIDLYNAYDKMDFKGLDFIIGTNKDEYRYWIDEFEGIDNYEQSLFPMFQAFYAEFMERDKIIVNKFFRSLKDKEIWNLTEFINEYLFRIPAIVQTEKIVKRGGRVFMYYWTFPSAKENFGACHAVELSSIFNNLKNIIYTEGNIDENLAKNAQQMWINFATNGNPSIDKYAWNQYDLVERKTIILGKEIKEEKDLLSERRKLLSPLAKYYIS